MAKHRRMSDRSRRTRTVIGGLAAGGAIASFAPAGMAAAAPIDPDNPVTGPVKADTPAYSVGRDNLHNPAPGLRAVQTVGDQVFNDNNDINKALNGSPIGQGYHTVFGKQGDLEFVDTNDDEVADTYVYKVGTGEEGLYKGVLNMAGAKTVADAVPVRECNFVSDSSSKAPVVSIRASCNRSA